VSAAAFVGDVSFDTTIVVDHVPAPDEKVHTELLVEDVGGVVANAAVACALWGSDVRLHCAVTGDTASVAALAALKARGIDVRETVVPGATSRAIVLLDPAGEKRLVLLPGATMHPPQEAVAGLDLDDVDWVHTAAYGGAATRSLLQRCRDQGVDFSLDLEPATLPGSSAELRVLVDGARAVFVNERSAARLGADGTDLLRRHTAEVVETRGPRGAVVSTAAGRWWVTAPAPLRVVDTTGAGDALAGVYVAFRRRGAAPVDALRAAVDVATASVSGLGAGASYPGPGDLQLTPP